LGERAITHFRPPRTLTRFKTQGGKIFLYHSRDDKVVPFTELEKYKKALPGAVVRDTNGYNHFEADHFPQILRDIRAL